MARSSRLSGMYVSIGDTRLHIDERGGRVEIFEESGHFPQLEEPERYAEVWCTADHPRK